MKAKDLFYIHCKDMAEGIASDLNLILEPGEQPNVVTEDNIQMFLNQLLNGSKIFVQQQHILVVRNAMDTAETVGFEQLEHSIRQGFWVYLSNEVGLAYQQFNTKEAAEHFYHFILAKDFVDWKGIISTEQRKVYMWRNEDKHGEEKI